MLAGVERPELGAGLREEMLSNVAEALRGRFETVVVDLGVPPAAEVLPAANELLLVAGADLVAIWNARTALPRIREEPKTLLRPAGGSPSGRARSSRDREGVRRRAAAPLPDDIGCGVQTQAQGAAVARSLSGPCAQWSRKGGP